MDARIHRFRRPARSGRSGEAAAAAADAARVAERVLVRGETGERHGGHVVAEDAADQSAHVVSIGTMFLRTRVPANPPGNLPRG